MIRKTMMLGLVAGFLALGGCDWCESDCGDAAATDGAALQAGECEDKCAECLDGCDMDGMAASTVAGDVAADAAPATCPMSGVSGDCSEAASEACETQCEETQCDEKPKQCDTPCSEKPAGPSVLD